MGRPLRADIGNVVYHVINRGNFRSSLFQDARSYDDFIQVVGDALPIAPMRILAYCLMPNHWYMVLYPENDSDLSRFMHRITLTHTQRYHVKTGTRGYGHIYQGRYKSLPVSTDRHFLTLVHYVERNAKRVALVANAEDWRWSSAYARTHGTETSRRLLSPWPVTEPKDYLRACSKSNRRNDRKEAVCRPACRNFGCKSLTACRRAPARLPARRGFRLKFRQAVSA